MSFKTAVPVCSAGFAASYPKLSQLLFMNHCWASSVEWMTIRQSFNYHSDTGWASFQNITCNLIQQSPVIFRLEQRSFFSNCLYWSRQAVWKSAVSTGPFSLFCLLLLPLLHFFPPPTRHQQNLKYAAYVTSLQISPTVYILYTDMC